MVQHRARGAAADTVRPVAIDRVLADVEIERRQVGGAEIVHGRIDPGPVVALHRVAQLRVEFGQPVQHPALQLRHFRFRQALGIGETGQATEQPAQRIAQAAVQFGLLLEDFRADPQILGGVGHHHPQPQDVGAVFVADLLRGDHVAQRFRHLAALLVEHEAVRQHRLERRPPAGADRLPAARNGTSRDAGPILPDTDRPARADAASSSTNAWVEPDSNHTSTMSFTCS